MRFQDVEMKAVNVIIMQQRKATIENAFKWMWWWNVSVMFDAPSTHSKTLVLDVYVYIAQSNINSLSISFSFHLPPPPSTKLFREEYYGQQTRRLSAGRLIDRERHARAKSNRATTTTFFSFFSFIETALVSNYWPMVSAETTLFYWLALCRERQILRNLHLHGHGGAVQADKEL